MDNNKLWKILFFFNVNVLVAIAFVPYTLPFRLYVIKQPGMALDQLSISTNFTVGSNTNFGGLGFFFLAMLGPCCSAHAFSSCSEWGLPASCGARASHCVDFSCCGAQLFRHMGFSRPGSQALEHSLSGCGAQAKLYCSGKFLKRWEYQTTLPVS